MNVDELTYLEQKMLGVLADAAKAGRPCPTNKDLCDQVGYASSSAPSVVILRLEREGFLRVTRYQNSRQVYVRSVDASTAPVRNPQPHWRERPDHVKRAHRPRRTAEVKALTAPLVEEVLPPRVDRDPCGWCGVRADIGCRHSRAPEWARAAS